MNTEKPNPDKLSLRDWIDQSHGIKKPLPANHGLWEFTPWLLAIFGSGLIACLIAFYDLSVINAGVAFVGLALACCLFNFLLQPTMKVDDVSENCHTLDDSSVLTVEIVTHVSDGEKRVRELLKAATAASGDDSDKAVALFREAHAQIALTDTDQGIDIFLRLPRYLQEGGRADEGWREFNHLLTGGYPNMPHGDHAWHCMESAVYDKMRLFLQREKRFTEAVTLGVLSVIYDIKAMLTARESTWPPYSWRHTKREPTEQDLQTIKRHTEEAWEMNSARAVFLRETERLNEQLTKLLKRAKLLNRHDDALAVFCEWANAQPDADDGEYKKRFRNVLRSR